VGKRISFGDTAWYSIIGVVGDIRQLAVDEPAIPTIYLNVFRNLRVRVNLVVRTNGDPTMMIRNVKEAIWSVDKTQTITSAFTLDDAVGEAVARPRLLTVLLGLFGVMGLVLGALGIYGVLAYLVNQRQREIGVRIALGAQQGDVLRMIVGRGVALGAAGVLLGLLGAVALTRFMQGVLFGVEATDPLTFGGVAIALVSVAALASWIPARRASRVDPAIALRYD
jgi:ABC-type antimicrobial peptide transport system permease subunit